jgi:hypothetical protein
MTNDQIEKLKQLAAKATREAALPTLPGYRIHHIGKEIRAKLKAAFPATDFFIATSDGFDTMYGEFSPMVELRWNDEPSRSDLDQALHSFIEERRKDFYFETLTAHGFTCRSCGRTHGGTLEDKPCRCPDCGINPCPW